jgi:hypothetical protein
VGPKLQFGRGQRFERLACLSEANGHAERIAALHMIEPRAYLPMPITLGADKAYDTEDFVNELRSMNATPHLAQNTNGRSSAIDGRTTARQPRLRPQAQSIWYVATRKHTMRE